MNRYSVLSLARNALTGHRDWDMAWPAEPKPAYDVVIVGAGGLASPRLLSCQESRPDQYRGPGKELARRRNTGRNTTIIRSNYLQGPRSGS
jgi:sarcosine oxidase subunit beta